ncbi:MAG: ATP-binding protein [Actinomycetota bacterium]|nr:ATP-binding protein [Actinomycetota bacterium]
MTFPVLKALSEEQKVLSVGFFGVTKRQFKIVLGSVFACYVAYLLLGYAVEFTTARVMAAFGPVVLAASAVAIIKKDGRHLDWHIMRFATNALRPRVYLWRAERAEKAKQARRRGLGRWFPLSDAVQRAIKTDRLVRNMVRMEDGTYAAIIEVDPVHLALGTQAQQEYVYAASVELYNRLNFPIVEYTATEPTDVSRYVAGLRAQARTQAARGEDRIALFGEQLASYVENARTEHDSYDARSYLILTYRPSIAKKNAKKNAAPAARDKKRLKESDTKALQKETNAAHTILTDRVRILCDALYEMGAEGYPLQNLELLGFLRAQTVGVDEDELPPVRIWEPITLDEGTYASLTPEKLASHIRAGEEVRKKGAPHAIGSGDLTLPTLSDQIAPDAVRINSDHVRINGRHQTTLFITENPDGVDFGVLRSLLTIPGRVRVVKYVYPVEKAKAIERLQNRFAELRASQSTNTSGNVGEALEREDAVGSAAVAMAELRRDSQRFAEMSVYVSCEADTQKELHELVRKVRSRLAAMRITARVAREEAFEGWLTTRPFGKEWMTPRYTRKGFLTETLACFNTFATWKLDHEDGAFMGLDLASGTFAYLDNRRLMNPHMIVLGVPGGGKTFAMKAYASRQRLRDHRVVIIDPVGDSKYGKVASALGGQEVILGPDSKHKINPCDLNDDYLNINLLSRSAADDFDELDEEEQEKVRREARSGAFNGKILMLTRLTRLMASSDSGRGLAAADTTAIEKLWVEVYDDKGITRDPETHKNPPPTFRDFFDKLAERPDMAHIHEKLYSWDQGILQNTFDEGTNVNLDNKFLVLQISALKDRVKAPIMFAVLDFLTGKLSNPDEPSECLIDECWSLLGDEEAAELLNELWRTGRARNSAMIGISQQVAEFANSEVGGVIFRLSQTRLILRQDEETARALQKVGRFSDAQLMELERLQQGDGFLIVQDKQIPLRILASKYEQKLFNTDPNKQKRYDEEEREHRRSEQRAVESSPAKALPAAPEQADAAPAPPRPVRRKGVEPPRAPRREPTPLPEPRKKPSEAPTGPVTSAPNAPGGPLPQGAPSRTSRPGPNPAVPAPGQHPAAPAPTVSVARRNDGRAKIFAVVGPTSGLVAYNLAGLLADAGKPNGARVLFVDAEGRVSRDVIVGLDPEKAPLPPDHLTALKKGLSTRQLKAILKSYVAGDETTGLSVMRVVEDEALPANGLASTLAGLVDVIVVPCAGSDYGAEWLQMADEVVATAPEARALGEFVKASEDARGENGTLLAPMGTVKIEREVLFKHATFRLPEPDLSAFSEAKENRNIAAVTDDGVRQAFAPLARKLVAAGSMEDADEEGGTQA